MFLRSLNAHRRIPVDIRFETTQSGFRLTIGEKTASFEMEHQIANNPRRVLQTLQEQLGKLGDTCFIAKNITIIAEGDVCNTEFPYFIPISLINQWRRELTTI